MMVFETEMDINFVWLYVGLLYAFVCMSIYIFLSIILDAYFMAGKRVTILLIQYYYNDL